MLFSVGFHGIVKNDFILNKIRELPYALTNNAIQVKHKTESCVCRWLLAHVALGVTCFPALVVASDIIAIVLSKC